LQSPVSTFAAVMKKKSHLPFFGIGPLYVALIVGLTVLGMVLSAKGYLGSGIIAGFKVPMIVVGILIGVLGLFIWLYALFVSRIDDGIRNNRLVTDGIYAWCRNPLYTGWMFICIGVSLLFANLWMFVLPFIFWALMAFMMKLTEEKWLHDLYGAEYEDYCRRVNRTWPWFPSKNK
jgi:protein-S-isoprenylcysteine O-methyltransferase Ste14